MQLEGISELESWNSETGTLATTTETVITIEIEDRKAFDKLLKKAKTSWCMSPTNITRLVLVEPSGIVRKLQFVRLPYPYHKQHRWVEVREWLDYADAWRMNWPHDNASMQEWHAKAIQMADEREVKGMEKAIPTALAA